MLTPPVAAIPVPIATVSTVTPDSTNRPSSVTSIATAGAGDNVGALRTGDVVPSTAAPAPACPVVAGAIGDCSRLRAPGPQCESFQDTKDACTLYSTALQPRVAQKAVACILSKSGQRGVCDFRLTDTCIRAAVVDACIDPAVDATCTAIAANCGRGRRPLAGGRMITKESCMHALSAVSGTNRQGVTSCITEGCGVDACFYGLQ
jgi:hypothetical protein